jgi:hypothetical protein
VADVLSTEGLLAEEARLDGDATRRLLGDLAYRSGGSRRC